MIHWIGYSALGINLLSMNMKNMVYLRTLSLIANALYVVYGALLHAPPVMIGCAIAVCIHAYRLFRLKTAS